MANLTDLERRAIESYAQARQQAEAEFYAANASALADRLRLRLPDLDDVTIAKVVLAFAVEMMNPDETDGRVAGIAVTLAYASSVLGETGLIDPSGA